MVHRVLYSGISSPFAWRAILALKEKNLEYELKRLDFSSGENKSAEYLAMNPRG